MCWLHEQEYGEFCFDFLWNDYTIFDGDSIVETLKDFNIVFVDHKSEIKGRDMFFDFLTKLYDEGLLKKVSE
jgi:hypothetical protein